VALSISLRALTDPRPRSWFYHVLWALPLLPIQMIFVFGLYTGAAGFPYTKQITLLEAIKGCARASLSSAIQEGRKDGLVLFLPFTIAASVLAGFVLRRRLRLRTVLLIGLARAILGLAYPAGLGAPVLAVLCPVILLQLPTADGEYFSESWLSLAAIGLWVWYQAALLARNVFDRVSLDRSCTSCGYDLTGLSRGVKCPECGAFTP
jgi:hypothetical protein